MGNVQSLPSLRVCWGSLLAVTRKGRSSFFFSRCISKGVQLRKDMPGAVEHRNGAEFIPICIIYTGNNQKEIGDNRGKRWPELRKRKNYARPAFYHHLVGYMTNEEKKTKDSSSVIAVNLLQHPSRSSYIQNIDGAAQREMPGRADHPYHLRRWCVVQHKCGLGWS